jgi:TPR repeat protein
VLGALYLDRFGTSPERHAAEARKRSFEYFSAAARSEDPIVAYLLGISYNGGLGTIKSDLKAVEWFQRSAAKGFPPADNMLCFMYGSGLGVEENEKLSLELGRRAVKNGFPRERSYLFLGRAEDPKVISRYLGSRPKNIIRYETTDIENVYSYKFARGKTALSEKAFQILKGLAVSGHAPSQRFVAGMLYAGDGVDADPVLAYAWALTGAQESQNYKIDTKGNSGVAPLTVKQKNEGELLAGNWKVGEPLERSQGTSRTSDTLRK